MNGPSQIGTPTKTNPVPISYPIPAPTRQSNIKTRIGQTNPSMAGVAQTNLPTITEQPDPTSITEAADAFNQANAATAKLEQPDPSSLSGLPNTPITSANPATTNSDVYRSVRG